MNVTRINLLGAIISIAIYILCILVFAARLVGKPQWGLLAGIPLELLSLPLLYLLWSAPSLGRPVLYYVQVGLMLLFLIVELLVDYWLKIDFRQTQKFVIPYVMLFFAGTGGMLGVARLAGRGWMLAAAVLYLIMAALAFWQRYKTGM
jgi:hypothetical protein